MFQKYTATKEDLKIISKALKYIKHRKMKFIFKDLSRIKDTLIISYDSKYVYLWKIDSKKPVKIQHNLNIPDKWQGAWWAAIISKDIEKLVPEAKEKPVINGGLLIPFINLQKQKGIKDNPYTTEESYLATIIHELGHIYFGGHDKNGELAAFCLEYYASELFWPKHATNMNKFRSTFSNNYDDPHIHAAINGIKLIHKYPSSWPDRLF